jgi:DNA-binding phage protein
MAEDAHMTLDTVAADAGLNEKHIGTFIRGQGNPTYSTLLKLCARCVPRLPYGLLTVMSS